MDPTSAQTVSNYEVLLPPAHKAWPGSCRFLVPGCPGPERPVRDPVPRESGQHLTKFVQIVVRGKPSTGLIGTNGTFLAGTGGVSGTDATLTVSI